MGAGNGGRLDASGAGAKGPPWGSYGMLLYTFQSLAIMVAGGVVVNGMN